MAFTYLILNVLFIAAVLVVFRKHLKKPTKTWWTMLAALLVLTLVFDNLIIWAGIVAYDPSKLLGWYLGLAPVEDFMYALLAAIREPVCGGISVEKPKGSALSPWKPLALPM